MTKDLSWSTEKRKVADLAPAGYNPRRLTEKQRADLMASIKEFGEVEPVVVNTDGTIIGGHQRISIYADMGQKEIVVRVPSRKLTKKEEKRLNLRLNKNTGEWDWERLANLGEELLLDIGFSEEELKVNLGLQEAEEVELDDERLGVLGVYPPEAPRLKERTAIHCDSMAQYRSIKNAIESGAITAEGLAALAKKKS